MRKIIILFSLVCLLVFGKGFCEYKFSDRYRDPMVPIVNEAGKIVIFKMTDSLPGIVVQGILSLPEGKCAIINGEVVKEGEKNGNITLLKVMDDSVIVSDGNETKEIKIAEE